MIRKVKLHVCAITFIAICCVDFKIISATNVWDGMQPWYTDSACNCNGFSNRCIFDEALYNRTGHGGHCLECSSNRDGPNCERCRVNYYQREDGRCMPCDCNEVGSRNLQCNREGKCQCKPGVAGDKCDHCAANHFDFGSHGCKLCGCSEAGSRDNTPSCDTVTGVCLCKENVEGKRCRECKPGFFNLDLENEFGCTPCFCYGHASVCDTAHGYSKVLITSFFDRSNERWRAEDEYRRNIEINYKGIEQSIAVGAPDRAAVYLLAPDRFLGDQRASYNRDLQFTLRIGENGASPTAADVRLEGSDFSVSNTIFGQGNPLPGIGAQDFKFRLHEHPDYGWQPHLSARAFMSILANLTAIKIRATYTPRGVGFLDNVRLATAQRGAAGEPANWIERCECPTGYVGQFCESCAPGYRHSPAFGGPFMQCELCDCNKHAEICDSETGRCICQHNTAGDNCEVCAKGYYGNALLGTQYDCKPCLCPNNGACLQLPDNTTVCLECPAGYAGPRCDICSDGYFGDPTGESGVVKACLPCVCNHNIDLNAVGNCNRTTGECLKCIHNTAGKHCDHCLPGYYGDALAVPKGDCKQCECYPPGTKESDNGPPLCDQLTGQCSCKPHVLGRNCDQCEDGFYNIDSGEGCQHCNCDSIGSYNHTCNVRTGQCYCRPGITGLRCDKCEVHKYGFSREGCKSCDCDPIGSAGLQCESNGQCPCLPNVEGRICDRCKENKYDRKQGCIDCPPCYNLVLDAVNDHQRKLTDLKKILDDIANNPTVIDDKDFENKLEEVQRRVHELFVEAQKGVGSGGLTLTEHLSEIKNRLKAVHDLLDTTTNLMSVVEINTAITRGNVSEAESITDEAKQLLNDALLYLSVNGTEAYERAVEKSKEYGHQNDQMKAISHEARQKADELELEAKQIQNTANLARNMSSQAYEIAKKSVDKLSTTNHNTGTLKNVITSAKDKLETTQLLTKDTQERAQEVHKEALDVLQEVNTITIPPVNTKKLKNDAQWEAEEANQIIDKIDKLENQHKDMVEDILDLIDQSSNLLTNATDQQQLIDELLSDADAAKSKAEKAVALGDKTLEEATKTYETLRNFDQQVQDSKDAAANALEEVDKIRELIYDSSNKTEDAKRALLGAESNAEQARNTAQQAQNMYAEPASIEAEKINLEADTTHKQAAKLRLEANDFADRVAETANTLKNFEDQAVNDKNLISEAKRKVGQAESDSTEASKQVKKAVDEVQQIITILIDLPSISTKELDALEEKLKLIEMNFTAANLDQRIQQVREEKQKQILLIGHYEKEVERLTKEVENIRDISESLPDGCFKRTKLEP